MALINCPECGKEVSDKAEVCMNCGYAIKQYVKKKEYNEKYNMYYCPKCGSFYCLEREKTDSETCCNSCKVPIHEVPEKLGLTPYFDRKGDWNEAKQLRNSFFEEYIRKQPEFDEKAYRKVHLLDDEKPAKSFSSSTLRVGPNCPACGSTNTSKIGVLGRSTSIFAFGLASNKIGKNWKCHNCGHTW